MLFFESHFTEFKYGVGPNSTYLEWHVGGVAKYGVPFTAGTWYNFAYDIDVRAVPSHHFRGADGSDSSQRARSRSGHPRAARRSRRCTRR